MITLRQLLSCAALACAGLFASAANAAPITLTYTGTVSYGYDNEGTFGTNWSDLSGKSVQVSYGFDSSLLASSNYYNNGNAIEWTQTVTVGGVSRSFSYDAGSFWFYSYVNDALSRLGPAYYYDYWYYYSGYNYNYDQISQQSSGYLSGGRYQYSYQSVSSNNSPMNPPTGGDANWSHTVRSDDYTYGSFGLYDSSWNVLTYFNNNISSVSLEVVQPSPAQLPALPSVLPLNTDLGPAPDAGGSAVPEPASWLLGAAALAALVAVRRRRPAGVNAPVMPSA